MGAGTTGSGETIAETVQAPVTGQGRRWSHAVGTRATGTRQTLKQAVRGGAAREARQESDIQSPAAAGGPPAPVQGSQPRTCAGTGEETTAWSETDAVADPRRR